MNGLIKLGLLLLGVGLLTNKVDKATVTGDTPKPEPEPKKEPEPAKQPEPEPAPNVDDQVTID